MIRKFTLAAVATTFLTGAAVAGPEWWEDVIYWAHERGFVVHEIEKRGEEVNLVRRSGPGDTTPRGFTMHFEFEQNFKVEIDGITQGAFVRGIVLGVDEFVQEQALRRHASGGMLPTGETAQF